MTDNSSAGAINQYELEAVLEQDIDRFPIPIIMNPYEEQRELWRRTLRIREVVKRYIRIKSLSKPKP